MFCTCSFCCYVNVSVDCTITYSGGNNYWYEYILNYNKNQTVDTFLRNFLLMVLCRSIIYNHWQLFGLTHNGGVVGDAVYSHALYKWCKYNELRSRVSVIYWLIDCNWSVIWANLSENFGCIVRNQILISLIDMIVKMKVP